MGKSSPTKLQLKHIPDVVIMQTVYTLQNTWMVHKLNSYMEIHGENLVRMPGGKLQYEQKKLAPFSEICEVLKPLPEKLVLRKLQKLEDKGWLHGYGPSGLHFVVSEQYWKSVE